MCLLSHLQTRRCACRREAVMYSRGDSEKSAEWPSDATAVRQRFREVEDAAWQLALTDKETLSFYGQHKNFIKAVLLLEQVFDETATCVLCRACGNSDETIEHLVLQSDALGEPVSQTALAIALRFEDSEDPKRRDGWKRAVRRGDADVAQLKDPKDPKATRIRGSPRANQPEAAWPLLITEFDKNRQLSAQTSVTEARRDLL
ncbi:hypothetical protein HPB48_004261 [Haemaphysalis longicornis]|uniref:Uncharacterized protein n=1 Tax=Haemaphysalis longicornis TaxID=44386 RepID=A0A9J6GYT3_HAELO|nr:hypothetical protein HPB48_004261 [Haemaphysalis longicornis]